MPVATTSRAQYSYGPRDALSKSTLIFKNLLEEEGGLRWAQGKREEARRPELAAVTGWPLGVVTGRRWQERASASGPRESVTVQGLPGPPPPRGEEGRGGQSGIQEDTQHVPGTHPRAATNAAGVGHRGGMGARDALAAQPGAPARRKRRGCRRPGVSWLPRGCSVPAGRRHQCRTLAHPTPCLLCAIPHHARPRGLSPGLGQ